MWLEESSAVKPSAKCESGTQTDVHPVETNIVRAYEWNAWELRRKAIKMVGIFGLFSKCIRIKTEMNNLIAT